MPKIPLPEKAQTLKKKRTFFGHSDVPYHTTPDEHQGNPFVWFHVFCPNRLIKLEIDTPIANLAAQLAQGPGITSEQKASSEVILDSIRSSKMWPKFDKIAEEHQVGAAAVIIMPLLFLLAGLRVRRPTAGGGVHML